MKKIILILIITILLAVIYRIIFQIKESMNSIGKAQVLESHLNEGIKKNVFLKERLEFVKTDEFINEQARNELGLVKKDEYVILAPPPGKREFEDILDNTPNWKKWLALLF